MSRVFVGNVPKGTLEHELEAVFKAYGAIAKVWVARKPHGFAFVEYASSRDAQAAVDKLAPLKPHGWNFRTVEKVRKEGAAVEEIEADPAALDVAVLEATIGDGAGGPLAGPVAGPLVGPLATIEGVIVIDGVIGPGQLALNRVMIDAVRAEDEEDLVAVIGNELQEL